MGDPGIWLKIVSVYVCGDLFPDEVSIKSSGLSKSDGAPPVWMGIIQSIEGLTTTGTTAFFCPWTRTSIIGILAFRASNSSTGLTPMNLLFLGLQT